MERFKYIRIIYKSMKKAILLRIDEEVKERLRVRAALSKRSVTNLIMLYIEKGLED